MRKNNFLISTRVCHLMPSPPPRTHLILKREKELHGKWFSRGTKSNLLDRNWELQGVTTSISLPSGYHATWINWALIQPRQKLLKLTGSLMAYNWTGPELPTNHPSHVWDTHLIARSSNSKHRSQENGTSEKEGEDKNQFLFNLA